MPPAGPLGKRILFNRREARRLHRVARRLHFKAAEMGQLALAAKANGHHTRAQRLLNRALAIKAAAVKARVGAQRHRQRIVQLRATQRLNAKKLAERVAKKRRK
jgi:hypothetical protein